MDKQYLISFLATIKGDKIVVQGLNKIGQAQKKTTKTTEKSAKATETYSKSLSRLAKRALLTIPIWLLLRSAFMGVLRLISSMVQGYLELEDGLARIKTVVHGTTEEISSQMATIKIQIKDMAVKTRVSLKELAETFYFLRTSSLTTAEAISAFEHTVDAMTGTGIKGMEMARAVAGVYNTMGDSILAGASASEKMQKIADVLTYTYATQDVQMNELIAGYTKLAPFTAGLSDSFSDLVTMIGWLNTKMLRSGRTGRLTARAFLQITKNADKLAQIFKVTFDPDKPLNFINIMGDVNKVIKTQGKITAQQTEALRRVFATRALTPVQLIIKDYDSLVEAQKRAVKEAEGFAKRIADIKMQTVRGQMERTSNIMKVLFEDFVTASLGAGDFVEAITKLADALESFRKTAQGTGDIIGWLGYNMGRFAVANELFMKSAKGKGFGSPEHLKAFGEVMKKAKIEPQKSPSQYIADLVKEESKLAETRTKQRQEGQKLQQSEQENQADLLAGEKLRGEELKHEIALMKILGATGSEVARFRLEQLEMERAFMTDAEFRIQRQIRLNALIQEESKNREEVKRVMQNLYVEYIRADEAQDKQTKERVRSLMNALTLTPEQMTIWWRTATDKWREMILDNFKLLTKEQKDALKEYWQATKQFPDVEVFSPVEELQSQIGEELPSTFWTNWTEKMMTATDKFRDRFLGIVDEPTVKGESSKSVSNEQQFINDWKKYYKEQKMQWDTQEEVGFRKSFKTIERGREETPTETSITINISRIEANGVTPKEVEDAIPGALFRAIQREDIIKEIRRKV